MMTRREITTILLAAIMPFAGAAAVARADEKLLTNDCSAEIGTYCANVSPGQNRVVACLIAYEDKVSPRCRLSTYLSSGDLDERMKALRGFATVCSADILQYCSKIQAGGGRIYDCLKQKQATLTDDCRKAAPQFEKLLAD